MKKILFASLLLCLLVPMNVDAKRKPFGNGLYWELSSDGILTISGNGDMPDYGYKKGKAPWMSKYKFIRNVIIENGVKSIGDYSFYETNKMCIGLKEVVIPNSVTSIGRDAFRYCKSITSIVIPNSITSIGEGAFGDCRDLTSIVLPNSITTINGWCFRGCTSLTTISIPISVTSIGTCAFVDCNSLKSIIIPNSVKSIGDTAFGNCVSLQSVSFPNSVTSIGCSAFRNCTSLSSVVIPNSVTSIERDAFYNCKSLTSVTIPNSVKSIGEDAFANSKIYRGEIIELPSNAMSNTNPYYIVKENGKEGIMTSDGKWIIPLDKNYSNICVVGDKYIKVASSAYYGILTADAKEIIPTSRGYTSIDYDGSKGTFAVGKHRYTGVCDAHGKEISMTKLPPTASDIKIDGGYASAVEVMNGSTKYYKVSKGGKYGLTNAEGKVIVPTEMEALEQAGTGYLRYKLNGFWGVMNYAGKIIIDTDRGYTSIGDFKTFNKRFPYTMNGYKGECNQLGVQVSKIKVVEPQQSPVSSSSVASFVSEDLKAYDLRGKVKNCKWKGEYVDVDYLPILKINNENLMEFSQDGKLQIKNFDIIRDNSGRITQLKSTITPLSYELYYDAQGRLIEVRRAMPFLGSKVVDKYCYSYDSSNRIESIRKVENYSPDNNNEPWCRFEYVQSDSKGNWTKRIAKCGMLGNITQSRVIEYY